ncbi:hypothetical protein MHEC_38660 [Mycobacterium heckeshornense]|uniref:Uncharacterized protein n=2 Tax=Mycobacterium heckeshornense TaxID=110505 RepID=A0A7R7GWL3_9MYCO|nr:hypothetical protein MHEC_38660 [Mycobacterium heckeshornense]
MFVFANIIFQTMSGRLIADDTYSKPEQKHRAAVPGGDSLGTPDEALIRKVCVQLSQLRASYHIIDVSGTEPD